MARGGGLCTLVESAQRTKIFVTDDRLLYDTHMHTPLCKHAVGDPEEYAAVAESKGLKGIIITCHNPTTDGWSPHVRMAFEEFESYCEMVERTRKEWIGRVDVRLGLESDFFPGAEPWLEELHARAELHYVLGSVHCQLPQYQELYFSGDVTQFQLTYYEHLAMAAESGLFDCLAHPDLVKNEFPEEWDPHALMEGIGAALDRIAATGIAMELNTSGLHKRISEMNPGAIILREMSRRGIPVVVGSDAHRPDRVADDFDLAFDCLESAGFTHTSFFLGRTRHDVELVSARGSLSLPRRPQN